MSSRLTSGASQLGDQPTKKLRVTRSATIGKAKTMIGRRVQVPRKKATPAKSRIWGAPKRSVGKR
ncbi:hypothetical protein [Candidatus Palauibacter sp.]|uniref:hypothetical protein n=1 Tax=Candidatus Palauibacter sp. TaxID=3101350 RepID=UPI003B022F35